MKIGEAAATSGCHLETIRYYERIGLLPKTARAGNGYREYGTADVDRLRFITRGRELGFSLDEIRSLLRLAANADLSCADADQLARQHLRDVQARIAELRRMEKELERTIQSCAGGSCGDCAILGSLQRRSAPGAGVAAGERA